MKIILIRNDENLGDIGTIKEVSSGYARNYLLPKGIARLANANTVQQVEKMKERYIAQKGKDLEKAKLIAEKLKGVELNISQSVHDENKLFGSVGASDIAAALSEKNFNISKNTILVAEPIRELGIYDIELKLHPEVSATVKVWVTPKE